MRREVLERAGVFDRDRNGSTPPSGTGTLLSSAYMFVLGGPSGASVSPAALAKLPAAAHHGYVVAYAHSLQTVFLLAVPIGAIAFLLTFLLPEITLRRTIGTSAASEPEVGPLAGSSLPNDPSPPPIPARAQAGPGSR